MPDARLQYIAATLADVLGGDSLSASSIASQVSQSAAVSAFVDDPHTVLLCAQHAGDGQLALTNAVSSRPAQSDAKRKPQEESKEQQLQERERACEVHLLKRQRAVLPSSQLSRHVLLLTTFDSPLYSLYLTLHEVYAPKLAQSAAELPPALQQQFLALEQQLHAAIITQSASAGRAAAEADADSALASQPDSASIVSVDDELLYWQTVSASGSKEQRQRCALFLPHLQTLCSSFSSLNTASLSSLLSLQEDAANCLHDLWTEEDDAELAFPQPRMQRLIAVIGEAMVRRVRQLLQQADVWTGSWGDVREMLAAAVSVCDGWESTATDLVRQSDWKPRWRAERQQAGSEQTEPALMRQRLQQILAVRALYEELLSLLPSSASAPSAASVFAPFLSFDAFHPSPFTAPLFASALAGFYASVSALEAASVSALRSRIASLSSQPTLLLNECRLHPTLLSRPEVAAALEGERRLVVGRMQEMVEEMKAEYEAVKAGKGPLDSGAGGEGGFLSPFLQQLSWAHRLKAKLASIASVITRVFPSAETERFSLQTRSLAEKVAAYARQAFSSWSAGIVASLSDPASPLHLSTSGTALMELDLRHEGELLVHYSPQLVTLLRECRLVSELGYRLDSAIAAAVKVAERFYRYGLKLRQIANCYNSMSEQILPSQLPLLMAEAQSFEQLVKQGGGAGGGGKAGQGWNWDRLDDCDRYVERLEAAAEELMNRNRKLRQQHHSLSQLLLAALNVDSALWKGRDQLMELVGRMRAVFAREEKQSSGAALHRWRLHWDHQLYKVLSCHYRALLYSFTQQPIDIPLELTVARRRLAFRPPMEEVRSSYYRNVKKLIDLPKSWAGFSEGSGALYASIPERHADGLLFIFSQCERLFEELQALLDAHSHWAALQLVDVEDWVSSRLRTVADWELNFKALRQRRKDSERLPDSLKVGCFTVSLLPFKSAVDDAMHRLSDTLLLTLRQSTQRSQQLVDAFLKDSMLRLSALPASMDEMAAARAGHEAIVQGKAEMAAHMADIADKDTLLRAMSSIVSVDLAAIRTRWDDFLTHTEAYSDLPQRPEGETARRTCSASARTWRLRSRPSAAAGRRSSPARTWRAS